MTSEATSERISIPPAVEVESNPSPSSVAPLAQELIANVEKVIVGKHEQIVMAVATLLAQGHLLIEDVPGVAKTMLARALAQSAGCSFKRIQCTPDLQPADVLGEPIVNAETGQASFRFGPLFSQFVLIDEVNRANPRTQAAMLEAMGEGMITSENITYKLDRPFMVIATQNPIEHEGTSPLPEAQKDRFLIRLSLGYPSLQDEKDMCLRLQLHHPIDSLRAVAAPDRIVAAQSAVRAVEVDPDAFNYILELVRATRVHSGLLLGASPRATLALFRFGQAMAAIEGRNSLSREQVKLLAGAVLSHRVIVHPERKYRYHHPSEVIEDIINGKPSPLKEERVF